MKLVARILLVFLLFTSVATAWESDDCGQVLASDQAAAHCHNDGSSSGNPGDLCSHCGHLSSHMLGYIGNIQPAFPPPGRAWYSLGATVASTPSISFLFRPPRYSFAA